MDMLVNSMVRFGNDEKKELSLLLEVQYIHYLLYPINISVKKLLMIFYPNI